MRSALALVVAVATGLSPRSLVQKKGGTVLLTTHYMDEAERLCDRLAIVDHGQIIAEGTPSDLIDRLGGHHVVEFRVDGRVGGRVDGKADGNSNGQETDAWRALPSVESVRSEDGTICLNVREPHLTIPALLGAINQQGHQLEHLSTRQASLEDVFVNLTGRHLREN